MLSYHLCLCRGDHSYAEAYLTVVARGTESVVFSIDGSFTASVSIMGSDPKVRAGAVDVVRWVPFNQGVSLPIFHGVTTQLGGVRAGTSGRVFHHSLASSTSSLCWSPIVENNPLSVWMWSPQLCCTFLIKSLGAGRFWRQHPHVLYWEIPASHSWTVSTQGSWQPPMSPPRHWQDSGYMIIYVTGRPDMQKHRVVAWLSQHNFPHGAVSFCDGLTHDPLRQKAAFLQSLRTEVGMGMLPGHRAGDGVVWSMLNPVHLCIPVEMLGVGLHCHGRAGRFSGQAPAIPLNKRVFQTPGVAVPVGRAVPCPNALVPGQAEISIVAGYGSTKDVSVYSSLGLTPAHIYIVGRAVKKFHNQCQVWWWQGC